MAMSALAVDMMLPAFDEIRHQFGLANDATDVAPLITAFVFGLGIGQVPAGMLADRYGRRPVLWGGIAVYALGAAATAFATSLGAMIGARLIWGLGAAGPRVAALAIVRDCYEGALMAREMSTIMAVFLMVPLIAPSFAALLLVIGPWQIVVWTTVVLAMLVLLASLRLPATMAPERRRGESLRTVYRSWVEVFTTKGTIGYLLAMSVIYGGMVSFIASSENIVDRVFGIDEWFPIVFAVMAGGLACASLLNRRIVESLGLRRLLRVAPVVQLVVATILVALAAVTAGTPSLVVFGQRSC